MQLPHHPHHLPQSPDEFTRYQYTPLPSNTIRLLQISQEARLQGDLIVVPLADRPRYTAVSYHWGEETGGKIGFPEDQILSLSRNLHTALLNFRHGSKADLPLLWIDQICINQEDVHERQHQIGGFMREIYSGADEVVVWLGDEAEMQSVPQLSWAVDHLIHYNGKMSATRVHQFLAGRAQTMAPPMISGDALEGVALQGLVVADKAFTGLLSLWDRPWFERLWVRQEVALARKVTFHCGRHRISLEKLAKACEIQLEAASTVLSIGTDSAWTAMDKAVAMSYLQIARAHELFVLVEATTPSNYERESLLDVLRYTFDLKSSRDHDLVYAIYHLSSASTNRKFWPDYHKPIEKLWRELAAFLLNDNTDWNKSRMTVCPAVILALPSTQDNTDGQRSLSWIPRFDKLGSRSAKKFDYHFHYSRKFAAGGVGPFEPIIDEDGQSVLKLEGMVLSKVASIQCTTQQPSLGDLSPKEFESDEYWKFVREELVPWYLRCHQYAGTQRSYDFGKLLRQVIDSRWPKSTSNLRKSDASTSGGRPKRSRFLEEIAGATATNRKDFSATRMYTDLLPFMVRDAWCTDVRDNSRILAICSDKRKGWVPESTLVGDSVILIKGAPFPFVVRETTGRVVHDMIGDAYIDGVKRSSYWARHKDQTSVFRFE